MGLTHHWEYERPEHSLLFNIVYTAFTDDVTGLDSNAVANKARGEKGTASS